MPTFDKQNAEDDYKPPNYLDANYLSRTTQWYLSKLMRRGFKKQLGQEDLPGVLPWHRSALLAEQLDRHWKKEQKKKKPVLARACVKFIGLQYIICCIGILFQEFLRTSLPVLISLLVDYFQGENVTTPMAYLYAALMTLFSFLLAYLHALNFHRSYVMGMNCRAAAGALIFRKLLTVDLEHLSRTTHGKVLNYVATDIEKLVHAFDVAPYVVATPIMAVAITGLLINEFGLSFLAGLLTLFFLAIIMSLLARGYGKMRLKTASWSDRRIHTMQEIISGMRVVKLYCWENPFGKIIGALRRSEIRKNFLASTMDCQIMNLNILSTKVITFFTIITYVLVNNELTPQQVLKLVAWVENLRVIAFFALSEAMSSGWKAYYSIMRIQEFLVLDDTDPKEKDVNGVIDTSIEIGQITIQDISARWTTAQEDVVFNLRAECHIEQGELVALIGKVGCGKSSLLQAIMNQMPIISGRVVKCGTIAYVPQTSWVFSGTFRENILFGREMEPQRYEQVIKTCELAPDVDRMPHGDQTLVGERGLSLSGGQKARINLARAVYRNADIYLLDDPLSAVDSKVGNNLFQRCICEHLREKTRLLVTHQLQYLKHVDRVIILNDGCIVASGTYGELSEKLDFSSLLAKDDKEVKVPPGDLMFQGNERPDLGEKVGDLTESTIDVINEEDAQMQEEEETYKHNVSPNVYFQYLKAGGVPLLIALFVLLICVDRAAYVFADWWVAEWATWYTDTERLNSTADDTLQPESWEYMRIYAGLVASILVLTCTEALTFSIVTSKAARNLHTNMFKIVLRAPLKFFERRPVGQILNRFARDTGFMDDILPQMSYLALSYIMSATAMLVFVSVINPFAVILSVPLIIAGIVLRQYSLCTTRDVKRIEATSRSPVYSHVTATLQGMSVIRAFNMEQSMVEDFDDLQNQHTANWFTFISCNRWLGQRLDWITNLFLVGVVFMGLLLRDSIDGAMLGLSLTYIVSMLGTIQFVVRVTAEVESYMTSVERILEYAKLEQEAPAHLEESTIPPEWPSKGEIAFQHASLSYFENGSPALNDISISINAGEKIGVVGRTGAGKSSLIAALMRLKEPEGTILIDGIHIATIGLDDLRNNISVIPQDPVLFTDTLRANLDPFNLYDDKQILEAIDEVELREKVDSLPGQLYSDITEGGDNFSVGQKQLLCLARALLRQNKILVIDEATANVDQRTDALIQHTIRAKFVNCTVVTIAHRLITIIDSHRVLVLDKGKLVEFDEPFNLLRDQLGLFYEMVTQTGQASASKLMSIAEQKYHERKTDGNISVDGNIDVGSSVVSSKICRDGSVSCTTQPPAGSSNPAYEEE